MPKEIDAGQEFASIISNAVKEAFPSVKLTAKEIEISIMIPKPEFGDLSSSIVYRLAKIGGMPPPNDIANSLIKNIEKGKFIEKIENAHGYLNAWLNVEECSRNTLEKVLKNRGNYGSSQIGEGTRVIVEFPSVNPNKPWHIGHLRNALLGDCISNILSFCSYKIEREDYINDLGLQMAEILWGKKHLKKNYKKKYDRFLGEVYVEINKEIISKKAEEEVNNLLGKMEKVGSEESVTIRDIAEKCLSAQYETAFNYGVYHDVMVWESDIIRERLFEEAMALLEKKGVVKRPTSGKYNGAVVLDLDRRKDSREGEESMKVLIRSNGAPAYIAKDIAFHMWKLGFIKVDFKYSKFILQPNQSYVYSSSASGEKMDFGEVDVAINIIGAGQKYNQEIVKRTFELFDRKHKIIHLAYGEVGLKEGALSGRSGGWIGNERDYTADDLLSEVQERALEIVKGNEKINKGSDMKGIANSVALGAIKFEFLKADPERKVTFEWDRALDFNSNSGPYCMYTYARASRILEKADIKEVKVEEEDYKKVTRGLEFDLIKMIGLAEDVVRKACIEYRPNLIADYLLELSLCFSRFYEQVNVLKGNENRGIRLAMVFGAKQVIYNMLKLLGIEAIDAM